MRPVLRIPPRRTAGLLGFAVDADPNGVWLLQAAHEEPLKAVLVRWQFIERVVAIIELERPKERVGF